MGASNQNGPLVRLIISEDGMISYVKVTQNERVLIDGPVSDWNNNRIKSICGATLQYDASEINRGKLRVDGYLLSNTNAVDRQMTPLDSGRQF